MHNSVGDIHKGIHTKNFNMGFKIADIYSTSATTCAGNFLKVLHNDVQLAGDTYQ